jgi:hypothetical protein
MPGAPGAGAGAAADTAGADCGGGFGPSSGLWPRRIVRAPEQPEAEAKATTAATSSAATGDTTAFRDMTGPTRTGR